MFLKVSDDDVRISAVERSALFLKDWRARGRMKTLEMGGKIGLAGDLSVQIGLFFVYVCACVFGAAVRRFESRRMCMTQDPSNSNRVSRRFERFSRESATLWATSHQSNRIELAKEESFARAHCFAVLSLVSFEE